MLPTNTVDTFYASPSPTDFEFTKISRSQSTLPSLAKSSVTKNLTLTFKKVGVGHFDELAVAKLNSYWQQIE